MEVSNAMVGRAAALLIAVSLPLASAWAQSFEKPPSFNAAKFSWFDRVGENYTVSNPVRSDGLLRAYVLTTPYGQLPVRGDGLLRMRLTELAALAKLEKISGSETFGKAVAEAGLSPLKYTGQFIANPARTIGDTFAGIGAMFERAQSGMANAGKAPGDPLAGLLGVTEQRRKLAVQFGVDPYTDYQPLDDRLSRLSEAAAAGGLAVSGAMFAIPGAAGIVVSNLKTASSLEGIKLEALARDYTAAQIFDLNRKRLRSMGADEALAEALLANRNYTPIDMAAIVAALDSMPEVADRVVYLNRAAEIDNRTVAYLVRQHAELLASQHAKGARFERFISLRGYLFNMVRGGGIVGVVPIDALSWTEATASVWRESAAEAKRMLPRAKVELRITGMATKLAKREFHALGWNVVENIKF
jgi:hypothetical protein